MYNIKQLYRENIYGVMGTLIFHILLVAGFWLAELNLENKIQEKEEEAILIDFPSMEKMEQTPKTQMQQEEQNMASDQSLKNAQQSVSNRAVNDAANEKAVRKDKFFDENYKRDIEEAKKMVADVNKQLSKKIPAIKKYEMPEATTEGQDPDSIKNIIYSGKSNIHYFLENRFHVSLPIPVYLAKSGGEVKVDIQVDRSGRVIKTEAKSTKTSGDPLLTEYALQAAERSVFNADPKAPSVQKGSITYKFVAQ